MSHIDPIRTSKGLRKLQLLRAYGGAPDTFWSELVDSFADLVGADAGLAVEKTAGAEHHKVLAVYSAGNAADALKALQNMLSETLEKFSDKKVSVFTTEYFSVVAVPLLSENGPPAIFVLLKIDAIQPQEISVASMTLMSFADIPLHYQRQRKAVEVLQRREQIMSVLDLNVLLNSQARFLPAAMVFCNELASAYKCTRVSLGWRKGTYIRMKAMSQTDNFEKKMEIVQNAEAAMEEAAEQNSEIRFPFSGNDGALYVRDHEQYLKATSVESLLTIPIRHGNEVQGVCLLEKQQGTFSDADVQHIHMSIDQVAVRLHELQMRDRRAGERFAAWARDKLAVLLGFEHTWTKLIISFSAILLIISLTVPVRYRVSSPMILKTDDITFLAAPFDGYISSVYAKAGERVGKDTVILCLDKKDLVLEEAGLEAEETRLRREEARFRADEKLAEMRIAQSQREQQQSRLDIVRLRHAQADIRAPFSGIIIEGEQHEKIGSPVRQGEVLFKLGRIEDIRVEAKVSEYEIQNVLPGVTGQIALASRPNELYGIKVQRVEPAAVSEASGNIFQVVCSFDKEVPQWFRPGMTGISKIDAGKRTIFWIISHRTFDILRLKFWW
jgi:biotin carboxyl carrier protein